MTMPAPVEVQVEKKDDGMDADIDDTPVVRFVNKVLLDAINKGASDIHIEPYEKVFRIRFRQDGVATSCRTPPVTMATRLKQPSPAL